MRSDLFAQIFLGVCASLLCSPLALAVRNARVLEDAAIRGSASEDSPALQSLKIGDAVVVSNYPKDGYFRLRTKTGEIGFVQAKVLELGPLPLDAPAAKSEERAEIEKLSETSESTAASSSDSKTEKSVSSTGVLTPPLWRIQFSGGYTYFDMSSINSALQASVVLGGTQFSAVFARKIWNQLGVGLKLDWISQSTLAQDSDSRRSYQWNSLSLPFQGIADYEIGLGKQSDWRRAGFFLRPRVGLGLTLLHQLSVADLSEATPNTSRYAATSFVGVAELDLGFRLGAVFGAQSRSRLSGVLTLGGRLLSPGAAAPSELGNGSDILKDPSTGQYLQINPAMNGFFVGVGLGFEF